MLLLNVLAVAGAPPPHWSTHLISANSASSDYECQGFDDFRADLGCQVKCQDDNCTRAVTVMQRTRGTHAQYNCCPPYSGCVATLKRGHDSLTSLPGDTCERRCAARLDRDAFYQLELTRHRWICKPRGGGNATRAGGGRGSSLALIGDYLRARNVAIDFSKTECKGQARIFNPGFLTGVCTVPKEIASTNERGGALALPPHLTRLKSITRGFKLGAFHAMPQQCAERRTRSEEEKRFTVFVSRDDMGNYAHHLGDMLSLFQVFDHLNLKPSEAQVALLDVRLMCWGKVCQPDCFGPFAKLWGAMTNGAPLVRAADWAGRGPMCFREAVFSTHWSEVAKLAWAPPTQCVGSTILRAFRLRVMGSMG